MEGQSFRAIRCYSYCLGGVTMADQSPEVRRDQAVADIIRAGGMILGVEPLAHPDDPHSVVAYRVRAGASSPEVLEALEAVQADTEVTMAGFVPWTPEPVDEGVEEVTPGEGSNA